MYLRDIGLKDLHWSGSG